MSNQNQSFNRSAQLRKELEELQTQLMQFAKIKELYNVSFDVEMRRLQKAISFCRESIRAQEMGYSVDVG
jgi:hypothetical protein